MDKLKASSIYESVISIAIISITITVATFVFVNIMNSKDKISYYQAIEKVEELKNSCIDKQLFNNISVDVKEFTIHQTVDNYKENEKLKWIKYEITANKRKVKTLNYLIRKK